MLNKVKQSLHKHFLPPNLHKSLNAPEGVVRPKVWIDVVRGEESNDSKRIEIELFSDIVPKTAENFRQLCTGECGRSYERATFHRVVPGFTVQGGDIINGDGTGIWSIYGGPFPDENFNIPHSAKGLVSMANQGPNTNGCQFFITLGEAEFLNGKHVVFGRVIGGWDVVKKIEAVPVAGERPTEVVGIVACGGDGPAPGQQAMNTSDDQRHGAGAAAGADAAVGGAAGAAGLAGQHAAQQQQGAALPTEHVNQPQHALPQQNVNQSPHALPQEHTNQPQHALPPGQQQIPSQGVGAGQQGVAGGVAGQGVQQGVPQQGVARQEVAGQQIPGQQGVAQQSVQQGVPQQGIQQGIPQRGIQQGQQLHQQGQAPVSAQQLAPEQQGQAAPLTDRFPDPPQAQPAQGQV